MDYFIKDCLIFLSAIVCFLTKEPRPVDLGNLMIPIYWVLLPTPVIFNVLESTQTHI
jgi:hypothetical protein